jgi:Antitoxin Xre/MbcA/ParS C-terminal toxin-binding domain
MKKTLAISGRAAAGRSPGRPEAAGNSFQPGKWGELFGSVAGSDGSVEPSRLALALRTTSREIVRSAGLSDDVARRASRAHGPKSQQRLREMIEIIDRVGEWAGGREFAVAWYRSQPIPAFGGQTAEALVKSGQANAVREYLDGIALGGFA